MVNMGTTLQVGCQSVLVLSSWYKMRSSCTKGRGGSPPVYRLPSLVVQQAVATAELFGLPRCI